MRLDEIQLANTPACFEPTLDYVVTKMPRFPFDKFTTASNTLSTQMKATGEVMSVGRTMEESLLKAIRSLEDGKNHIHLEKFDREDIYPVYKMIDTCASEFDSYVPYFYSTYEEENESIVSDKEKIIVLGSGPIRIGQGVEFDYSTVHAIRTIHEMGYEAIVINNNPETVSTDYTTADKLYFEPLTVEDIMNIIDLEKPKGVIATLGGQTAVNLAEPLTKTRCKDHRYGQ